MNILSAEQIRELDQFTIENAIIKAHLTLSFLPVKQAFLFQENKSFYGEIVYLDIGLLLDEYLKQKITGSYCE